MNKLFHLKHLVSPREGTFTEKLVSTDQPLQTSATKQKQTTANLPQAADEDKMGTHVCVDVVLVDAGPAAHVRLVGNVLAPLLARGTDV